MKKLIYIILFTLISLSSANAQDKTNNNIDVLKLEKSFPGPFKDTIIQRLVDQKNNVVCYIYIPAAVEASKSATDKMPRFYGSNIIGSISCLKK
jgi:hypothetical protein